MLKSLYIKNYALIDELDIKFATGFSVITGETGAGKSIIIGAISTLLGQRADSKSVKVGESKYIIEGDFSIPNDENIKTIFEENDLEFDASSCIVRREVLSSGKSRSFVNDTPVNIALLRTIGKKLIDIHSQHQNLLINDDNFQLRIIDLLAANAKEREAYANCYNQYRDVSAKLKALEASVEAERAEQDYISFQLEQIEKAELKNVEEQQELEQELEILSHAEEIKEKLFSSAALLSEEANGVASRMRQAVAELRGIENVFSEASKMAERLESARIEIDDVASEIDSNLECVEYDPARQSFVEERLDTIYSLEKKHGVDSIESILAIADKLSQRLDSINGGENEIDKLKNEQSRLADEMNRLGDILTATREKAYPILEKEMVDMLMPMGMPNIRFTTEHARRTEPDVSGFDKINFAFSANKNVPLQDIAKIASGGEIARVMLALKAIISNREQLPTIIFDEIDTGVSGSIAEKMAETMKLISKGGRQVISITHLPQIAAYGEHHFKVYKEDNAEATVSHIVPIVGDERVKEIANMLSGSNLTDAAISNAKELLKQSNN